MICGLFIFHQWNKWEEYRVNEMRPLNLIQMEPGSSKGTLTVATREMTEFWQKRTCKQCGLTQRRKVEDTP